MAIEKYVTETKIICLNKPKKYFIDEVLVVELVNDIVLFRELEVVDWRHDHDFGDGDLLDPTSRFLDSQQIARLSVFARTDSRRLFLLIYFDLNQYIIIFLVV